MKSIPSRGHPSPRSARPHRTRRRLASIGLALALSALAPPAGAQDADDVDELRSALERALATIDSLSRRVTELESKQDELSPEDDLELLLDSLIVAEPEAAPRSIFPSVQNPSIGVIMDAVAEAGNAEEELGEGGDRFALRETEIDIRSAIAPFAEGALVLSFEDAGGGGEFENGIEEGFADIALGEMLGVQTAAKLKVGRFRAVFGASNAQHTHDTPQVDRPIGLTSAFGHEGLIADGLEATLLLHDNADSNELGSGHATRAQLALVNGDALTGEEGALSELAEDAGLELDSDSPLFIGRLSHHVELSPQSDVEVGASLLTAVGSNAVRTDAGTNIDPMVYGIDATARFRDDESGMASWLFSAEAIRSQYDFNDTPAPGAFPAGVDRTTSYWLTGQRQVGMNTYFGLRVGQSELIGSDGDDDVTDYSPYVTWYANEFFRLRLQGQHLDYDRSGGRDTSVNRAFLQCTWSFGAHRAHPYWTNR